eukprot:TRINITY_DN11_c1_g1_i2.p1 TRINITY_DN11_c1_g1~~TRINITY_DN11_c1_g1_i2.p1  ORF type:complete len:1081 (+),score=436.33 TRINITY_DN11_c1_g1_i2:133-3243(+)
MPDDDKAEKEEFPVYLSMIMDKSHSTLRDLGNVAGVLSKEGVDPNDGPAESSIDRRRSEHGRNELEPPEEATLWEMIIEAFQDNMVRVLVVAAVVSLVLGLTVPDQHTGKVNYSEGWIEGTAILVSVFIVTVVSAANEYQKEQKFKELSKAKPPRKCNVRRGGRRIEIMSNDLVQGDVCHVKAGDDLTADGLFVEGQDLKLDESAVTGENIELPKNEDDPFMVSGSSVIEGEGWMVVIGVGVNSLSGRSELKNREKKDPTPLQEKLDGLVEVISWGGAIMALLTFSALIIKEIYQMHFVRGEEVFTLALVGKVVESLTVAVTIVVVAVPEGLPLSVTIALAYSMKRMMEDNNLVRHLAACETMGGATQICSDKTGTLTQNKMTVVRGVFEGDDTRGRPRKIPVPDHVSYRRELEALSQMFSREFAEMMWQGLSLNSTAFREEQTGKMMGNKTECAILEFVEGMGQNVARLREKLNYEKSQEIWDRHTYPFSSAKKRMVTLHRFGNDMRVHCKGASELVLQDCTKILTLQGTVEPIDESRRARLKENIADMARQALRTIAVAYAERPGEGKADFDREAPDDRLTLLCILAIEDPIRPEVPLAVRNCAKAGITVRMVTGDNKATAIAIAKEAGIYDPTNGVDLAMEGKDFREFDGDDPQSKEQMTYVLSRLKVLARMTPIDKQILVESLRSRGEIVAVTGDGTNDAPALKLANVGFAMLTGTEVAKAASDIILMDDNFASVVTAAMWGRNINDNIRKFIQFQSTVNIAAVLIAFLGSVFSEKGESPLKPVQLLWLNLIMDSMAALALATESPYPELLDRPPNFAGSPLISRRMWVNMLGQSAYQIVLQLWLLHRGFEWFEVPEDSDEHMTIIFNTFVMLQVVNEFNARKIRNEWNLLGGIMRAKLFMVIIVVTVVVQVLAVQYAGKMMGCVPLNWPQWEKCIQLSLVPLPIGIILRAIPVHEPPPPTVKVPDWVSRWRRTKRLFVHESSPKGQGRGKQAFRAATKEVIQQMKVSGALATLRRRRPRRDSHFQLPAAPH